MCFPSCQAALCAKRCCCILVKRAHAVCGSMRSLLAVVTRNKCLMLLLLMLHWTVEVCV